MHQHWLAQSHALAVLIETLCWSHGSVHRTSTGGATTLCFTLWVNARAALFQIWKKNQTRTEKTPVSTHSLLQMFRQVTRINRRTNLYRWFAANAPTVHFDTNRFISDLQATGLTKAQAECLSKAINDIVCVRWAFATLELGAQPMTFRFRWSSAVKRTPMQTLRRCQDTIN